MTNTLRFSDLDKVNIWLRRVLLVACMHTSHASLHADASRVINNISKFQTQVIAWKPI